MSDIYKFILHGGYFTTTSEIKDAGFHNPYNNQTICNTVECRSCPYKSTINSLHPCTTTATNAFKSLGFTIMNDVYAIYPELRL